MEPIFFFHGLEGSPEGTKGRFLADRFAGLIRPQLSPDPAARLELVLALVQSPSLLVGSSLGGLTALMFAQKKPELVTGLLLVAPAVGFFPEVEISEHHRGLLAGLVVPAGIPTVILGATQDHLIPQSALEALVVRSPEPRRIELWMRPDDHSLNRHLEAILAGINRLREL
ncbi:MAG: hypothetical protein A2600_13825 [Candidatus Lambdaproteobacteria bacterium RIFOXYD1_FULL_56_27]|uniref:Serine aminopeptidase S33 domain-containing protein n=1 Tax=Candidatus Lambdaproteobacteria bacterium RIFOXYD2_FULL_56_26 TaxID=1817773 RepID=A0A1F6GS32_9PROT|nr:MAG: hypothetical protein A2426_11160 [Candidatus Lambdaproteobacteria bacterium RIFOXYC1_FULL_56_13]OGH00868.1 MAG: hypothetical protein A2557_01915 [Candidatus Lambdaproteobacteria bacterium RIFOXYD2_FULL_56_26]OGH08695.1 MAG: hypothetical protein A2600_13825 [Candidatus Lambdaproteobacteria bacterium RIFOXYD1_FULL_56_27]